MVLAPNFQIVHYHVVQDPVVHMHCRVVQDPVVHYRVIMPDMRSHALSSACYNQEEHLWHQARGLSCSQLDAHIKHPEQTPLTSCCLKHTLWVLCAHCVLHTQCVLYTADERYWWRRWLWSYLARLYLSSDPGRGKLRNYKFSELLTNFLSMSEDAAKLIKS